MSIVQMLIPALLIVSTIMTGCTPSEEKPKDPILADAIKRSVADWLHDLDALKRFDAHLNNLTPDQITPLVQQAINVSGEAGKKSGLHTMFSTNLRNCWKGEQTTANTDHACLDAAGYVRSK